MIDSDVPVIQIPRAFEVLRRPKRFKVFFGGRGSGKSESIARQLLINAESKQAYKTLCAREIQKSIDDSVHGMLDKFIGDYQFPFEVQNNVIKTPTGGYFKFTGLKSNVTSLKSKFDYDVCWVEEAESITQKTWDVLIPTFRKGGSELWISFNPSDEMDATYQEWVYPYLDEIKEHGFYEDDELYVALVNYDDNPFFPDELRKHSNKLKERDYKKWLHVYGGEPDMSYEDSIIEPEWFEAAVDAHKKLGFEPRGERICGFDPADTGRDAKARTLRYGVFIQDCASWLDGDITDATQRAVDDAVEFRATDFVYDNIGNGSSVKTFATLGGKPENLDFVGFGAGDSPDNADDVFDAAADDDEDAATNRDTFRNKRAQYWWLLRLRFFRTYEAVSKGRYHDPLTLISVNGEMPELAMLKSELVKVQRKRTAGSKLIQIESKDEMRKRGVPSPNLADSLMMSFAVQPKSTFKYERRATRSRR